MSLACLRLLLFSNMGTKLGEFRRWSRSWNIMWLWAKCIRNSQGTKKKCRKKERQVQCQNNQNNSYTPIINAEWLWCIIYLHFPQCVLWEKKIKRGKNRHPIIKTVRKITIPTLKIYHMFSLESFQHRSLIDLNLLWNPNCENHLTCFTGKKETVCNTTCCHIMPLCKQ